MRSILVTGGTGTFGQAFVEFLLKQEKPPSRICIYSRGEHAQAAMRARFNDDSRLRWFIGDVRDVDRLRRAMESVECVVHAAALKRIEVGQYNPEEMVKTNVLGTMNVIEAARQACVKKVVGLSSDKAYQPISPYGQSKALAESILLAANGLGGPLFSAVRYGNIWKAQGSVVPKWIAAFEDDKYDVQATDLNCTRFFMTARQAVELVRNTLWTMKGGELVIPKSLPAYRLGDLAQAFFELYAINVTATGLPPWEKMHESMCDGLCSETAPRMTVDELREAILNG